MPLGVRWTKNIYFCKFPAWLCPSFLKQSILNIWFLRPVWYQAECRDKVVLIQKRPFLSIFADWTNCCLFKSITDHEPKVVAINSKIKFQMVSLTSRRPYLCPSEGHKYGVSILSIINLCGKFRQITRKRCTAQTWDLDKLFIYLSSIISEIHSFCRWMVWILFFYCVTVKTTKCKSIA